MQPQPSNHEAEIHASGELIHNAATLSNRTYNDKELEYWAIKYQSSAGLKSRLAFHEFMTNPNMYWQQQALWPDVVWEADVAAFGDHSRLWVNNQLTGKTIDMQLIRANAPHQVRGHLSALMASEGKPDAMSIKAPEGRLKRLHHQLVQAVLDTNDDPATCQASR